MEKQAYIKPEITEFRLPYLTKGGETGLPENNGGDLLQGS